MSIFNEDVLIINPEHTTIYETENTSICYGNGCGQMARLKTRVSQPPSNAVNMNAKPFTAFNAQTDMGSQQNTNQLAFLPTGAPTLNSCHSQQPATHGCNNETAVKVNAPAFVPCASTNLYREESMRHESTCSHMTQLSLNAGTSCCESDKIKKQFDYWKPREKTEFCQAYLRGVECTDLKYKGRCSFAHSQEELQKKPGLSAQYKTSACKKFLKDPKSCTFGVRCHYQHPTADIEQRQPYTVIMQDNARLTAERNFQEIEGARMMYINAYGKKNTRLSFFKTICDDQAWRDEEDLIEEETVVEDKVESIQPAFVKIHSTSVKTSAPIFVPNFKKDYSRRESFNSESTADDEVENKGIWANLNLGRQALDVCG